MKLHAKLTNRYPSSRRVPQGITLGLALLVCPLLVGQVEEEGEEAVFELSPFEVTADERGGYQAADTLAGNRLNTKLRDIGNAVSVVTEQFLQDTGATDNKTLLQYTTGTEVGGLDGSFAGFGDGNVLDESADFKSPNQNTRVRGLAEADNTREFFLSDIPWDGYNVDRVELQRGPNSILFGQGSPAGLINVGLQSAAYEDAGEVEIRFDQHGSTRYVLNLNEEIIEDELAVRIAGLYNDEQYRQKPAFSRDKRLYGAIRWDPGFMNGEGLRTTFKANYEDGAIESNNPRTLPPIDRITPWFESGTFNGRYVADGNIITGDPSQPDTLGLEAVTRGQTRLYQGLNRQTFNAHQLQQDNLNRPNQGQGRPGINGGPFSGSFNPDYNPRLGNFAGIFGGTFNYFGTDGGTPDIWQQEIQESRGIGPDGEIDSGVGGFNFNRAMSIATEAAFGRNAGLPFGEFGLYNARNLTDASIFDFYDNLIDGPNKEEWQDFQALNVSFSQTYMEDTFGFDVTYNQQDYENGQLSLLSGSNQALFVDIMGVFPDGTSDAGAGDINNIPFSDGTPNPNVGRAFVAGNGQGGNNSLVSERESFRVTPFYRYTFNRADGNWFTNLLGRGTFTGLYSKDTLERENRSWQQYAILDQAYMDFLDTPGLNQFTNNFLVPGSVVYLGDSLSTSSTAAGANIPRIHNQAFLPRNATARTFDSTWGLSLDPSAPNYVNPAAEWINHAFLPPELEYPDYDPTDPNADELWPDRRLSTQSENPANYVGWREVPYTLTASEDSAANRELLATRAALDETITESEALIWQGHLWNDSLVGTYGWRKDRVESRAFDQDNNTPRNLANFGHLDFDPSFHTLEGAERNRLEVQSRSYSIVTHFDQIPFLEGTFDTLPFRLSFFYNSSTNFQPESSRVDVYGESIAAPKGETTDRGILIQSRDGRYSFKVNKYKSTVTNGTSSALSNGGFIGASQAWGANWANQFEYDFAIDNQSYIITHMARNRPEGSPVPPNFSPDRIPESNPVWGDATNGELRGSLYNYGLGPGETLADAQAREAAVIGAWRDWQAQVDPRFYEAWDIDLDSPFRLNNPTRVSATTPQNFAITEDSTSEGYEFEFALRPTDNWNIMINASKTEAVRRNIGGENLSSFIAGYQDALRNTPAGDLRIWWGGAGNETTLFQWDSNVGSEWTSRKLQEGTNVPELREWRWNLVTNYDFTDGAFKGFNVGGGVRWQDSVVIGFPPIPGDNANEVSFNLSDPYMGPTETNIDLWAGYGRAITDRINWSVQVNVRNAFQGDDLIPITTQPDGTPAGYRIAPAERWSIRNTFSF